jgi:trehalose 6-phosphate phosphatase
VVAAEVHARLAGRHLLLLTDFDGTLADLVPHPADAVMTDDVRGQLARIAALPSVTLGVVSGRRLSDVRARVGPLAPYVGGLHGLEITGPSEAFAHPSLETIAPIVQELTRAANQELSQYPGVLIEDKTFSLTCHVRQASPEDAARALDIFEVLAEPQIERGLMRLLTGSKAHELVPDVDWHKGRAVEWIRARVASRRREPLAVIYLGDDRTDEDAFAALEPEDLAIGVGPRPHTHLIQWRLAGPASVGRFFGHLAAKGDGSRSVENSSMERS